VSAGTYANTAQPLALVAFVPPKPASSPFTVTPSPATGWLSRSRTWTESVPLLPPAEPIGGVIRESMRALPVAVPTVAEVTVLRRRRKSALPPVLVQEISLADVSLTQSASEAIV